jgi:hypothetical protein
MLIVVSLFLSFIGCSAHAKALKKALRRITLCDCLALLVFLVIERPHWKKKEGFFTVEFIFAVNQQLACTSEKLPTQMRAGRVHTGGACAGDEPAEAFISCWVFSGEGGLDQDHHHDVGGTNHIPLKKIVLCQGASYCKYVLFVSTILKVPTEFYFGISILNTKKYWPILTKKYRLGKQL